MDSEEMAKVIRLAKEHAKAHGYGGGLDSSESKEFRDACHVVMYSFFAGYLQGVKAAEEKKAE